MIHIALTLIAILFLGWLALQALGLIVSVFAAVSEDASPGCGCLTLIGLLIGAGILMALII